MKKINNLSKIILAITLLFGGEGYLFAQTYWGTGCWTCEGNPFTIITSQESGIQIDGNSWAYYFGGVYSAYSNADIANSRPANDTVVNQSSQPVTLPPSLAYTYYDNSSNRWKRVVWTYGFYTSFNGRDTNSDSIDDLWDWVSVATASYYDDVYYPTITYTDGLGVVHNCIPNNTHITSTNGAYNNKGGFTAPSHSDDPLQVYINGGSIYVPLHFNHFQYITPQYKHWTYSYNPLTNSWTSGSDPGFTAVTDGQIIINAGKSVRLHATDPAITKTGSISAAKLVLADPNDVFVRFDATYDKPNNVTIYSTTGSGATISNSDFLTINSLTKGLGFWNGVAATNNVLVKQGYLFLGPNTGTPNEKFSVNQTSGGGTVYIENYWRQGDVSDNGIAAHDVMIDFTSFTLGAFPLYISNSNQCKEIIFNKAFAPILSSSGSVNIGVAGAGSNVAGRGNGTVRFKQPVTFTNGTGAIIVHGGNIEFESTAPYTYSDNTAYHEFIANSGCAPGNIHFQGGAVSVTKRTGETYWKAANLIKTEVGSTVTYNISGSSKTNWIAGDSIWLRNDVTFTLSTSDSTNWFAGNHIFAEYCSDAITYDHQGTGHITWKAGTNIELYPTVSFSKTNSNNGRIWWYAGNNINTHNSVTFTHGNNTAAASPLTANGTKWEAVNNIIVDQNNTCSTPVTVSFTNSSTTTTDDYMWWYAGNDVKVQGTNTGNRINVNFTNNAANSDASTNFMKWEAHSGNIDIDFATIAFSTTSNSKGYTEWYAYNNILMDNSSVDFTNAGTTSSAKTYWYAYNDDINANNTPITFNNTGEGYTHWKAGRDILLHDNSPTSFTDAATTDYIWLEANRDFRTGVASPLTIDHASPAYIKIEATNRNIWTQSSVDIVNSGTGNNTDIYAGMDIRLDSTLTYTASQPINYVKMRADQGDIIVNTRTSDVIHDATNSYWGVAPDWCDGNRAAVNFTLKDAGYTEWWAAHNIIATDSIKLHYDNKNVGDVLFHADQNNIDLRRPVIIDYGSTNNITFEAVNSTLRQNKHSSNGGSYNGTQNINLGGSDLHDAKGNIRTSDSVIINRSSSSDPGITKFEAYNDIQTAMVDFIGNSGSTGDTTYVNSKAGDLWLGYSWENPAACGTSSNNPESSVSFDLNRFVYNTPNATTDGLLLLTAGYDDAGTDKYGGGNIYFTHIVDNLLKAGNNRTEISIPYSNMFMCSNPDGGLYGIDYERAGIISGVWRCQASVSGVKQCTDTGLIHIGNKGELLVNAGTRGNIIFNNGGYLDFQDETGVTKFLTQWGDIDMRDPFNVDSMRGGLLFYANSLDPNKLTYNCGCEEKRNNVYLQDFQYTAVQNSGSVFVGADNNIKLNYGGLKNIATQRDPFFSNNAGYDGVGCGSFFHCDADTAENHARDLILNFDTDINGSSVGSGGFAAVSSDLIDVYKNMVFHGGQGSGMSTVPTYTTLHGASVAGYGLYILTQANKNNYTKNDHDVNANSNPLIGAACDDEECTNSYLHNTARVTFHADARIYTQAQKSIIASPVLETYGNLDLNTHLGQVAGGRTAITIRTDSLIMHDSLIIDGTKTTFEPWSDMPRNMPVFKLGHQRFTPPFGTASNVAGNGGVNCDNCYTHAKDEYGHGYGSPVDLDTIFVTFRYGATVPRLHTLVADHAKITFLTDSFDHQNVSPPTNNPTVHAMFKTDTFKIRNHVELFEMGSRQEYDAQLELISEEQMISKNYAGIYTRHIHFEPIAPECSDFPESQLWPKVNQMEVIPSSTLGGFGWLHASVNVQIGGNLFPGYASLGADGNCYEQFPGVLKFEDARIDHHANLKFSIGANTGHYAYPNPHCDYDYLGLYADCIDVDSLTVYDEILLDIVVRGEGLPSELLDGGGACYPLIHYNTVTPGALNHIKLKQDRLTEKDHPSIDGTYYISLQYDTACHVVNLCISTTTLPVLQREIRLTENANVRTVPAAGMYRIPSDGIFSFIASYTTRDPLQVKTSRIINGVQEIVQGVLGETRDGVYTYTITNIQAPLTITFGPEYAGNVPIDGAAVWSYNDKLYIRVERDDVAKIYSIAGQLVHLANVKTGTTELTLRSGVYVVALNGGARYKVVIK